MQINYASHIKGIIRVKNVYSSEPDFLGGVDLHIIWQNLSDKVVKYANFTAEPYNAVGDVVECKISGKTKVRGQFTGPVYSREWRGESVLPHQKTYLKPLTLPHDKIYLK